MAGVVDQPAAEWEEPFRDGSADVPHADDPDGRIGQIVDAGGDDLAGRELPRAGLPFALGLTLDQGQHQHDRLLRRAGAVDAGVVGRHDARLGQRSSVERVGACSDHLDEAQGRCHGELRGADRPSSVDEDRGIGGGIPELRLAEARDGRHGHIVRHPRGKAIGQGRQSRIDQEHLHHRGKS